MKENFNTEGVSNKVTFLLALSTADFLIQRQILCTIFSQWMAQHFYLSTDQLQQLNNMPVSFQNELGLAIANSIEARQRVQFLKEDKKDEIDWKELSIQGLDEWQEPLIAMTIRSPLFISIRYNSIQ